MTTFKRIRNEWEMQGLILVPRCIQSYATDDKDSVLKENNDETASVSNEPIRVITFHLVAHSISIQLSRQLTTNILTKSFWG